MKFVIYTFRIHFVCGELLVNFKLTVFAHIFGPLKYGILSIRGHPLKQFQASGVQSLKSVSFSVFFRDKCFVVELFAAFSIYMLSQTLPPLPPHSHMQAHAVSLLLCLAFRHSHHNFLPGKLQEFPVPPHVMPFLFCVCVCARVCVHMHVLTVKLLEPEVTTHKSQALFTGFSSHLPSDSFFFIFQLLKAT